MKKVWGKEIWYANIDEKDGANYCGKILELKKGYMGSYHCHKIKDEVFYVQSGLLRMKLKDKVFLMGPGDMVRLKPNTYHQFLGLEDTTILESSTFHSDKDVYRETNSTMTEGDPYNYIFDRKEILVVGDVILDKYLYGDVSRISPEGPIPVVNVHKEEYRLGGAANVAWNLVNLNQDVTLIGLKGKPNLEFTKLLQKYYIEERNMIEDFNRPTTFKTRIIANNQHIVRIDREDTTPLDPSYVKDVKLPLKPDAVIISDYNKGTLIDELVRKIIKTYKGKCPIIVDPKKDIEKYKGATILKPNEKELNEFLKTYSTVPNLMIKLQIDYLIVTMGAKGFKIYTRDGDSVKDIESFPVHDENIVKVDVTGAGDTFTATLATALATGFDVRESAKLANFASGLTIQNIGTYAPKKEEFKKYYVA